MAGGGGGGTPRKRPIPPTPGEGTGSGGTGGRPGSTDKCDDINEFTDLLSPKADALAKVKRGERLTLRLTRGKPPILALTPDGEVVGSVVPLVLDLLISCMKRGRQFVAEVISKAGGACKVRIVPEDK